MKTQPVIATKGYATLQGAIREIFGMVRDSEHSKAGAIRDFENVFRSIARCDYAGCLKLNFSRRELNGILQAFGTALPKLDHEQFKLMPLQCLASIASSLGLQFQANPFNGPGGTSLRGFYVGTKALKHPLICLNTAQHPTAINSAFWHEVGHHLTARLLSPQEKCGMVSFGNDFDEHLNDPRELAADMLVSLVGYSHSAAKGLFGPLLRKGSADNIHAVVSAARPHLDLVWGFNLDKEILAKENLHYLAGLIHFTKLRLALLAGYDT